jgi:hypothetical protein
LSSTSSTNPCEQLPARLGGPVRRAPVARQFAGDRGFQQRAAEEGEALARLLERRLALRDFAEQRVDPLDDAALLGQRREWYVQVLNERSRQFQLVCRPDIPLCHQMLDSIRLNEASDIGKERVRRTDDRDVRVDGNRVD